MIWGIYLAAGQSKRMGHPKLCMPFKGRPLGSMALKAAMTSMLDGVIVVFRTEDSLDWMPESAPDIPGCGKKWIHVPCEAAYLGMSESLKTGLRTAQCRQADAVVVLLADQPFVTAKMIDYFVSTYNHEKKAFIASRHQGIPRPPVLFDACMFPELYRLQGDEGARRILQIHEKEKGMMVDWQDKSYFIDIDTPNDYERLLGEKEDAIRTDI